MFLLLVPVHGLAAGFRLMVADRYALPCSRGAPHMCMTFENLIPVHIREFNSQCQITYAIAAPVKVSRNSLYRTG